MFLFTLSERYCNGPGRSTLIRYETRSVLRYGLCGLNFCGTGSSFRWPRGSGTPVKRNLESGEPEFPFCLRSANGMVGRTLRSEVTVLRHVIYLGVRLKIDFLRLDHWPKASI